MNYYEAEGKAIFKKYDIAVPQGNLVDDVEQFSEFPFPCVIKSQVLSGKRGKAGGIKFADNFEEMKKGVKEISEMTIYGKKVDAVLVEQKLNIVEEYYLGITIDSIKKQLLLMFSPCGGMDIETLAVEQPEKLLKFNFTKDIDRDALSKQLKKFQLAENIKNELLDIAAKLAKIFCDCDATTIEINPLVVNENEELIAADAKLVIDDNALFRQENHQLIERKEEVEEGVYKTAKEAGLSYVELDADGNIGLIAGGAGIGMATMDTVRYFGGKPFNFLDLGGGVTAEKTQKAMRLLMNNDKIDGIVVNIFGGINNCKTMAEGIKMAVEEAKITKTIVVKSRGHSQEEGWAIYEELGIYQVKHGTTDEAVQMLIEKMEVK
jgi:succinyl-CoA synthetase beta subunit